MSGQGGGAWCDVGGAYEPDTDLATRGHWSKAVWPCRYIVEPVVVGRVQDDHPHALQMPMPCEEDLSLVGEMLE